jgi:hypothetical protein
MSQTLLEMAKDLVMAQIAVHRLSPEDMHQALNTPMPVCKPSKHRKM